MKTERQALLRRLSAAAAGLAAAGTGILQGDCFVLNGGWVYTFNKEIACAAPTNADKSLKGAVPAEELLRILKGTESAEVTLSQEAKSLKVVGSGETLLPFDPVISLPYDKVERPADWQPIPKEFADACAKAVSCTKRKDDDFGKLCVHLTPDYIEACDDVHATRYSVKLPLTYNILVRGTTLKEAIPLGFTQICMTERWLHLRNPLGLRMSLRLFLPEQYPDYGPCFDMRGEKVELPRGIKGAALRASVVADPDGEGEKVTVRLGPGGTLVEAAGVMGRHVDKRAEATYAGAPMAFRIPAKLLAGLSDQRGLVEVTDKTLRLEDGPYIYISSLEPVDNA